MRVTKHQRQHRIARLLESQRVASQAQLVDLLAAEGVEATQTTVSRDLEELGALKVRVAGGETAYALPELPSQQIAPADHLRRVLGEWVVEVASSGNLVVLRTPPGCAHVVGSALDRSALEGIVGTVAGDDTVLVVVAEGRRGDRMAETLEALVSGVVPPAVRDGAGGTGARGAGRGAGGARPSAARARVAGRGPARAGNGSSRRVARPAKEE